MNLAIPLNDGIRAGPCGHRLWHAIFFRRATAEEHVMPAGVKVLGWRKGKRSGMVVRQDSGQTARIGGRMPQGANVEFAYRTGHAGTVRTYAHNVIQGDCSALLMRKEEYST